jgi:hypothetical protein
LSLKKSADYLHKRVPRGNSSNNALEAAHDVT